MWNSLSRLLLFQYVVISMVAANDVHTIYKMGKTSWGRMTHREFCPTATYVVGFRLRVHAKQGLFKDDTALNGIQLKCSDGNHTAQLTGSRGYWGTYRQCTGGRHVTGFNLRSEGKQAGDDAAATDVAMQCSDRKESLYGDGLNWGSWEVSGYQECPGGSYFCGVQARIEHGGADNTGLNEMIFICCRIVNGGWGEWTPWSLCSTSCNNGTQKRYRSCDNPKPMKEGLLCAANETRRNIEEQLGNCRMSPCPVDGEWSIWTSWSTCTTTCSNGTQARTRHCGNPRPLHGGSKCTMGNGRSSTSETEIKECTEPPCLTSTATPHITFTMPPAKIMHNSDGSTSFVVKIALMASNVRHYDVIVTELKDNGKFPRTNPNTYTNGDIMSNVDGLYVAGRVFAHNIASKTFVVGGTNNNAIRKRRNLANPVNKPLKEGLVYGAFVRGYVTIDNYITSSWFPPVHISPSGIAGASAQNEPVSHGTAVAVALVACAVVLALLMLLVWKRRRQQRCKESIETNRPIEMVDQANNTSPDEDDKHVYEYGMATSCDNNSVVNGGLDMRGDEQPAAVASLHQHAGIRYSPPVYADILTVDCMKFPDHPPAYEEIQESKISASQASSLPLSKTTQPITSQYQASRPIMSENQTTQPSTSQYQSPQPVSLQYQTPQPIKSQYQTPQPITSQYQSPQPITSQHQTTDHHSCDANPGYQELTNRLPHQNPLNKAIPGYDSLAHSAQLDRPTGTFEQVYDVLNIQTHPVNSQPQGYDHLHGNTSNVSTTSIGPEQMLISDATENMRSYEDMTDGENNYESLRNDGETQSSDYEAPYTE